MKLRVYLPHGNSFQNSTKKEEEGMHAPGRKIDPNIRTYYLLLSFFSFIEFKVQSLDHSALLPLLLHIAPRLNSPMDRSIDWSIDWLVGRFIGLNLDAAAAAVHFGITTELEFISVSFYSRKLEPVFNSVLCTHMQARYYRRNGWNGPENWGFFPEKKTQNGLKLV